MPYKDREKYLASQRGYYKKNPQSYHWARIKKEFGLTRETFFDLVEKQDNKCALCEKPFEGLSRRLIHIDHCHQTGRVRGLLCMTCNVALGMLGDTAESLSKALAYVKGEIK